MYINFTHDLPITSNNTSIPSSIIPTLPILPHVVKAQPTEGYRRSSDAFYDQYALPGVRMWMLMAAMSMLLTTMIVIVCCIIRLRIPRSRREIEIIAARRRARISRERRKKDKEKAAHEERSPAIVMNNAVQRIPSTKRPYRTDSKHESTKKNRSRKSK